METKNKGYPQKTIGDLLQEIEDLKSQKAALLAACKAVEFVWMQDSMVETCPWCEGTKLLGHNDNCQRQSAIKAGEA